MITILSAEKTLAALGSSCGSAQNQPGHVGMGLDARRTFARFRLEGELFSLDISLYRTTGWPTSFGSPGESMNRRLVNAIFLCCG